VFGLPSGRQVVQLDQETGALASVEFSTIVTGGRHVRSSCAQWVHEGEMERTKIFPTDGMSGAPVFHLGKDTSCFFIGLAGMVMRGSSTSDRFHFIDSEFLLQFRNTPAGDLEDSTWRPPINSC